MRFRDKNKYLAFFLGFVFVGLEADLQDPVAQSVAVEGLDGDQALVVVGHGHEPEPFALVRLEIPNDLDVLEGENKKKMLKLVLQT